MTNEKCNNLSFHRLQSRDDVTELSTKFLVLNLRTIAVVRAADAPREARASDANALDFASELRRYVFCVVTDHVYAMCPNVARALRFLRFLRRIMWL